ncbi:MAG: hypothetical protein SFU86_09335 [Pirellulaceae bacterium]|nr:hypothetical protein [Pirellulaceae bacterium]
MNRQFLLASISSVAISLLSWNAGRADEVQLVNGDILTDATVVGLDEKHLKLKSNLLGDLTIERAKVRQIVLGKKPLTPAPTQNLPAVAPAAPAVKPLSLDELLKQIEGGKELTPTEALKQLEAAGGDPAQLAELKKNMALFAAPEVQAYFRQQVGGLLSGKLTVNDIRNEAIRARDETKAALKDLGPDVEAALSPYLGILENFINETAPKEVAPAPALEKPAAEQPAPVPAGKREG